MSNAVAQLSAPVRQSPWQRAWQQFRRHRLALLSALVLIGFAFIAIFAAQLAPYNPTDIDPRDQAATRGFPQPPSPDHVFGTDDLNRDLFSRALYGIQVSLTVGLFSMVISVVVGVLVGAAAGYAGGLIDNVLMRIVDVFLAIPSFLFFLALNALLPPSIWNVILILGLFSWMEVARLVRAEFLSLKNRDFIIAAQALGAPPWRLIVHHLLPNSLAPIIVAATLTVPAAILSESALSFIGLGVPPPSASLGNLLQDAKAWLATAWWMWLPPGILISLMVLTFNFLGDGLRDALDPTMQRT